MKFKLIIDSNKPEEVIITAHKESSLTKQIEELVLSNQSDKKIAAYTDDGITLLPFSDIECITVLDGKTQAIDKNGNTFRIKQRLYELESILPSTFIKINKSSFGNETYFKKFTTSITGAVDVFFISGYKEYVSRRCFSKIKKRYDL